MTACATGAVFIVSNRRLSTQFGIDILCVFIPATDQDKAVEGSPDGDHQTLHAVDLGMYCAILIIRHNIE